jgi:phytoene/squalene synthetase
MNRNDGVSSFIDKWRARWPEWAQAMVFVPAAQRGDVAAWFALLQELTDAAWGGDDPTPGLAKLAWWQEELQGWAKGARRHPLGDELQSRAAPWTTLAHALPALRASRMYPGESAPTHAADAFAQAVADCEAALFDAPNARDAAPLVAASLAAEHALLHPGTSAAAPSVPEGAQAATRVRRMQAAMAFARLRREGRPSPPLRTLFMAWRAARVHHGNL